MELTATLSQQDKLDIARMTADLLKPFITGEAKAEGKELTTTEAMELLGYKSHAYFRKYLKRNRINACRKSAGVKYYNESDLLKQGNK